MKLEMKDVSLECPLCHRAFENRTMTNVDVMARETTDFMLIPTPKFNFYKNFVAMCPSCGFAGTLIDFNYKMSEENYSRAFKMVTSEEYQRRIRPFFVCDRLNLLPADLKWECVAWIASSQGEHPYLVGRMYLCAAWSVYGDPKKIPYEKNHRRTAIDFFVEAVDEDPKRQNRYARARTHYLIAEQYRRLEDHQSAENFYISARETIDGSTRWHPDSEGLIELIEGQSCIPEELTPRRKPLKFRLLVPALVTK